MHMYKMKFHVNSSTLKLLYLDSSWHPRMHTHEITHVYSILQKSLSVDHLLAWIITVSIADVGWTWAGSKWSTLTQFRNISNDTIFTYLQFICTQLSCPSESISTFEPDAKWQAAHFDGHHIIDINVVILVIVNCCNSNSQSVAVPSITISLRHTNYLTLNDCMAEVTDISHGMFNITQSIESTVELTELIVATS